MKMKKIKRLPWWKQNEKLAKRIKRKDFGFFNTGDKIYTYNCKSTLNNLAK